jgi:hypothetical protein
MADLAEQIRERLDDPAWRNLLRTAGGQVMCRAILTVVELHEDGDGGAHECPGRERGGERFTEYEIDCTTLREIAGKLGIEVDHG